MGGVMADVETLAQTMLSVNGGDTLEERLTAALFMRNQKAFQSDENSLIVRGVMADVAAKAHLIRLSSI
jgi:hypothetical protein